MANTIAYASIFQQELDKKLVADACTGWMDDNAGLVKYNGGSEIKIPKLVMDGLGNYNRSTGFVDGSLTLSYETRQMTQDRGRSFQIDAMDVDETNFALVAGDVMGAFQSEKVVPEVDAYRISKIRELAGATRERTYTAAAASAFKELKADIATVQDNIGSGVPLVVMISIPVAAILDCNESVSRQISTGEFKKGELFTRVKMIDEVPLISVPSARMKTAFTFYDGVTDSDGAESNPTPDQRGGGFVATSAAKDINWIVCAKNAPIGVCKTDTIRIFDPATHQKANAWKIDYRKYHDLWIPDNKLDGIYINRKA